MLDFYFHFTTGTGTRIVWGCTGLKQSFIWIVIMLIARGQRKHKLWFIPLGLVCAYLFNILRITLIAIAIEQHPDWFHLLHDYIFKYLFYGMLFCLWVWWTNRITSHPNNAWQWKSNDRVRSIATMNVLQDIKPSLVYLKSPILTKRTF